MASPALPFKRAEEAALRASAALKAAMGLAEVRLYTEVPTNAPLPYVVLGQHEIDDQSDGCGEAHEIVSTVQWWTKIVAGVPGSDVARLMGAAIVQALGEALEIEGHAVVLAEMETPETYGTDPDQSSRGRVAYRYETTALD
ncbi:hypothetical protein SGCZBJ_12580 [Caulobacter zeae]|uniref:DUF3168 domain-containing protein n=1 Tax=Caulobacter zeae TaxID=2055137 RepID=A0A2N5DGE9_9CAUL|nr:DUF3168 domain-containing protein [Caulobacter zeae]PLR25066.1 hypothetical protein SGCZBJ_12580 [Caulobacter zeae]